VAGAPVLVDAFVVADEPVVAASSRVADSGRDKRPMKMGVSVGRWMMA